MFENILEKVTASCATLGEEKLKEISRKEFETAFTIPGFPCHGHTMKNAWYLWQSFGSQAAATAEAESDDFCTISAASGVAKATGHLTQEDPKVLEASKALLTLRVRMVGECLRQEWRRTNKGRKGAAEFPEVSDQTLATQLCQWSKDAFGEQVKEKNQVTLKALGEK